MKLSAVAGQIPQLLDFEMALLHICSDKNTIYFKYLKI